MSVLEKIEKPYNYLFKSIIKDIMQLQKFAYCVKTGSGYKIGSMRFSKRESIKAYMEKTFPFSNMKWSDLTRGNQECVKIKLKLLTQIK